MQGQQITLIEPGNFEPGNHFYQKALNSHIHSAVRYLFNLSYDRLIKRYCHLNPAVDAGVLESVLTYVPRHYYWGGADLFCVSTGKGVRRIVVIETNSCPSGQKSMPLFENEFEYGGYKRLIQDSFLPHFSRLKKNQGVFAVLYDKNLMEAGGYAQTIADCTGESVYLVPVFDQGKENIRMVDEKLHICCEDKLLPVKAAFRYVTQKPWNRLPVETRTFIYNPVLVCLAGGRNKLVANKAYEMFNADICSSGLRINSPETVTDVGKNEIPLWVNRFGGYAVIKNPYSNAGQGVYIITRPEELEAFMQRDYGYEQFIVQNLIGHYNWTSTSSAGKFYQIGTVPNKHGKIFIADIRMMVYSTPGGFRPVAIYARRAKKPLEETIAGNVSSEEVLKTNLSIKLGDNKWDTDTKRLILMDQKDFNMLGIGLDDLIESFIQTILSIIAIDKMAVTLLSTKKKFKMKLFKSLDNDPSLHNEILLR